jgi:uncharacterized coiled-coil protein SlyX
MIGGWEAVTAIIGVSAVIGSTWTSIYKHNNPRAPKAETEAGMEGRIIKLEGDAAHTLQGLQRLEKDHAEKRQRFEKVVDDIFAHIHEIRKDFTALLKELRK